MPTPTCKWRKGDTVQFKPEWQDAGDEKFQFVAAEDYDGSGRLLVQAMIPGFTLQPTQIVSVDMLVSQTKGE